jgi:hypothetical protein
VEDEKDRAIIILRGVLVDVLENIAPDVYGPYIKNKKKEKQLVVQCKNPYTVRWSRVCCSIKSSGTA